ncbi:hypothetical protein HK096_011436, partial [Nowakowskiella sp. JEL0078]
LVEEEKFRKTCFPTLLKKEEFLRSSVLIYEKETGRIVKTDGQRFLDMMDKEISERFLNNAVLHIDSNVMLQSHYSATLQPDTRPRSMSRSNGISTPTSQNSSPISDEQELLTLQPIIDNRRSLKSITRQPSLNRLKLNNDKFTDNQSSTGNAQISQRSQTPDGFRRTRPLSRPPSTSRSSSRPASRAGLESPSPIETYGIERRSSFNKLPQQRSESPQLRSTSSTLSLNSRRTATTVGPTLLPPSAPLASDSSENKSEGKLGKLKRQNSSFALNAVSSTKN